MIQLVINGLIAGSFAALLACGLALVYGMLGIFNFALGQIALFTGYSVWWLHRSMHFPLILSITGGCLIGAVLTLILFELTVGPFYKRDKRLPLVTTIAASIVLDGLLLIIFQEYPRRIIGGAKKFLEIGSVRFSVEQLIIVTGTFIFLGLLAWFLARSHRGRQIRASIQNPEAAESLGINTSILHRAVFVFSGFLAGLGGIYLGIDQNLTPTLGFSITIKAYAALIAGGKNSVRGTIFCAYCIALIEQFAVGIPLFGFYIPAGYQSTVALLIIIIFLLLKPEGLFGSKMRTT